MKMRGETRCAMDRAEGLVVLLVFGHQTTIQDPGWSRKGLWTTWPLVYDI